MCGVTQSTRDQNRTRTLAWQSRVRNSLNGKEGYDEYVRECEAANPAKAPRKSRHNKEEMEEKFPLVAHGLVDHTFHTLLPCIVVAGVTKDELMS